MTDTITVRPTEIAWQGFTGDDWQRRIDVSAFLLANFTPYEGDAGFLRPASDRTRRLWDRVSALFPAERERGILDVDTATPSTITSHAPGYIERADEVIVG